MNDVTNYIYSIGNRLEKRNTYFYTPFLGQPFISAWRKDRESVVKQLKITCLPVEPITVQNDDKSGFALLERLYADVISNNFNNNLELLIQRFEVGKRLYKDYDDDLRPIDRDDYNDLGNYIRFAEVLDAAFTFRDKLIYLNPLLKVIDILVSMKSELLEQQQGRLANLIENELKYVSKLAFNVGVSL